MTVVETTPEDYAEVVAAAGQKLNELAARLDADQQRFIDSLHLSLRDPNALPWIEGYVTVGQVRVDIQLIARPVSSDEDVDATDDVESPAPLGENPVVGLMLITAGAVLLAYAAPLARLLGV